MSKIWRIEMFGGLKVCATPQWAGAERPAIVRFRTEKTAALLAYLAFFPRDHPREVLIELLWPGSSEETGRNNLRLALSSLRRQLEPPEVLAGSVLRADRHLVELNRELVDTDIAEFENTYRSTPLPHDQPEPLEHVVDLYRGPLLAGFYEDWIPMEEQRLEGLFFRALDNLALVLERAGETERALSYLHRGLRFDPQRLQTRQAIKRISMAAPSLRPPAEEAASDSGSRPAVKSMPRGMSRLPLSLTRFYGRNNELAQLADYLADSELRLITLTGTGGSGKTRLALETARILAEEFSSDAAGAAQIYFVPLADLNDTALIPTAIFEALSKESSVETGASSQPHLERIVSALNIGPVLLILDNFEHLVLEGAAFVQTLLQRLPDLTILATSRQRLGIAGEKELTVPPLALPPGPEESASTLSPLALNAYESIRLFIDRAQLARPDFQVTPNNAASVTQLTRWLEGLPLALELAAARINVLSAAQILQRLQSETSNTAFGRLDLADRRRGVPDRHRTLRATIAWSFYLLPVDLQGFFAQLSVFRGGFTAETAQQVCGENQALHALAQLRAASLVVFDGESLGEDDAPRFRMLETLREFAADQLTLADSLSLKRRHAEHYLKTAENAQALAARGAQAGSLDALEAETDNFRAAMAWLIKKDSALALRLAAALIPLWELRGYFSEGRKWLEAALESNSKLVTQERQNRAKTLDGAGRLAFLQGDFKASRQYLEECAEISRQINDEATLASALKNLTQLLMNLSEFPAALSCGDECLALSRKTGDRGTIAQSLLSIATARLGNGENDIALPLLKECRDIFDEVDDKFHLAIVYDALAFVAVNTDDPQAAELYWEESLKLGRALNNPYQIAKTLCVLGNLSRAAGNYEKSRVQLAEGMALGRKVGNGFMLPYFLEYFAFLAMAENDLERAARILGASEAYRELINSPLLPVTLTEYENQLAVLREKLDEANLEEAWGLGRTLSLEEALTLAVAPCLCSG